MNNITTVKRWLAESTAEDFVQIVDRPVDRQLASLDGANTGIGFVFVLVPIYGQTFPATEGEPKIELEMTSYAVFKMKGEWYVVVDENISDIARALIRMLTASIDK